MKNIHICTVLYLCMLSALFIPNIVCGADIVRINKGNYRMIGEIKHGDFEKFIGIAVEKNEQPTSMLITSPGGNVEEALKFGVFANEMFMGCAVSEQCNSSCFLIIAGCVDRTVAVDIGIHRPYFNPDDFGKLQFDEAQKHYDNLLTSISSYLREKSVPKHIIDSMISVPSNSAKFLSQSEFEENIGKRPPAYYEWLEAKCGGMSNKEKKNLETISHAEWHEFYRELAKTKELDGEELRFLVNSKKTWDEAQKMSEGYRAYLLKEKDRIQACENKAVNEEAEKRWKQFIKNHP